MGRGVVLFDLDGTLTDPVEGIFNFDAVVGSELDGGRSDKHEVITETLRQLASLPERGVMVGDREHDVLGAAHLGMSCVGVSWGYAEPGELEAAGDCQVVNHPEDLPAAIREVRVQA